MSKTSSSCLGACRVGHQPANALQHAVEGEVGTFEVELARLDLRQIEDVVDDSEQVSRRVGHLGQAPTLGDVPDVALQQVGEADDRVHRRPDLVAHVRQEGTLGPGRRFGRIARVDQLMVDELQAQLGVLHLGDVGGEGEEAADFAVLPIGDVVRPASRVRAVRTPLVELESLRFAGQRRVDPSDTLPVDVLAGDLQDGLAENRVARLADPFAEHPVDEGAGLVPVPVDDPSRGCDLPRCAGTRRWRRADDWLDAGPPRAPSTISSRCRR